jgi:DNA-binding LacI/PurR family transcriptional regulator
MSSFENILTGRGLEFSPDRCRSDLSFAWGGAGWEEFREIWFGGGEKPDALLVADENYLPEVAMAVIQLGIRVPQDLLLVSHRTRHVQWAVPLPVAYIEEDVDLFAQVLADRLLARIENRPKPEMPAASVYQLFPVQGTEKPITTPESKPAKITETVVQ